MALRQLSNRCAGLLRQAGVTGQACAQEGLQQQCGKHNALFQQLVSGMRADAHRHYSQVFQPSRLYPKQHTTPEAYVFWGLVGLNVATALAVKIGPPEVQQAVLQHCRTSVEAVANGRLYTLLTSTVCHTSLVHCALNLLMLLMYRRTQPLTAKELLVLYVLGGLMSSCTHIAWCWWDASGPQLGLRYALNTPGLLGCSGPVAAISAYKAFLEPFGVPHLGVPLPIPVVLFTLLYCCVFIREQEYSDYSGKFGAAAFGVLAALAAVITRRRRLAWKQH